MLAYRRVWKEMGENEYKKKKNAQVGNGMFVEEGVNEGDCL